MKFKKLLVVVVGMTITSAIPLTASAHSYSWWAKPRKVIVTKQVKIHKIKVQYPRAYSYAVKTATLKRGDIITVNHMVSYDWEVQKKGYAHNSYYFWVMNSIFKPSWITPYTRTWVNWNRSMGKHAYARKKAKAYIYKQPGQHKAHYLKNYPKTTWYTSRHAKIASGAIYYYVTSGNGKTKGWIWRGNLKPVKSKLPSQAVANSSKSSYDNNDGDDEQMTSTSSPTHTSRMTNLNNPVQTSNVIKSNHYSNYTDVVLTYDNSIK